MTRPTLVLGRSARTSIQALDCRLRGLYRNAESSLGNKDDPLDEAIFIILTFQTDIPRAQKLFGKLRQRYSTWEALERDSEGAIAHVLHEGGLHNQRARVMKQLLAAVRERFGGLSLEGLRVMSTEDAERVLTKLPGLSWKGARCVLLYGLRKRVFPVDVNTFRILKRLGVLPARAVYRRKPLHDALQSAVPSNRRRELHVKLVVHGQRVCLPLRPQCDICALRSSCRAGATPRREMVTKKAQAQ
jgi:endonuclease-3